MKKKTLFTASLCFALLALGACSEVATTYADRPECPALDGEGGAAGYGGQGGEAGAPPLACECTNAMAAVGAMCPESCSEPMMCVFVELDAGGGHANCVGLWQ
jgi:hypothetical protein